MRVIHSIFRVLFRCVSLISPFLAVFPSAAQTLEQTLALHSGEYDSLIRRQEVLRLRADSLGRVETMLRDSMARRPDLRNELGLRLLDMEAELFDVRNRAGIIGGQINNIELEWVATNLNSVAWDRQQLSVILANLKDVPNLIYNSYFARHLSPADYSTLVEAQGRESEVDGHLNEFLSNYRSIDRGVRNYLRETNRPVADSMYASLLALSVRNVELADTIYDKWRNLVLTKMTIYDKLFDTITGCDTSRRLHPVVVPEVSVPGYYASEIVSAYARQKQSLLYNERLLAESLGYVTTVDSLAEVYMRIDDTDYNTSIIDIREKSFIRYEGILFSSPVKYTRRRPIPDWPEFPRGTVYTLMLGAFAWEQKPSLFKDIYPLYHRVDSDGTHFYYAGTIEELQTAKSAVERLVAMGYDPQLVMWHNGRSRVLDRR